MPRPDPPSSQDGAERARGTAHPVSPGVSGKARLSGNSLPRGPDFARVPIQALGSGFFSIQRMSGISGKAQASPATR
jgi:hypothetical protein